MGFFRGANVVTDGLVLALDAANNKSYPGAGTVWNDLSGNGYTGTLTNGPTFNSENNGSIVFDGADDYSIGSTTLNINNSVTLEAFIYPTSYILGFDAGGFIVSNIGYYLELAYNGVIRSYFYGLSSQGYHYGTITIPLNTWSQVLVVRNIDDSTIKHYFNGALDNTISGITGTINNGQQNYQVGGYQGSGYSYIGRIPTVRIYNRALSAQEILQNYNAQKSRFNLT